MITNDQQYRATKRARDNMQESLDGMDELELVKAGIDPVLIAAQKESLIAAIGDLNRKLAEFAAAKELQDAPIRIDSVEQIGNALISARIANTWTQQDLADKLGLKQQQIQRYERDKYRSASLSRIGDIAEALGLQFDASILPTPATSGADSKSILGLLDDVRCFPIAAMKKRGWLTLPSGRNDDATLRTALARFFSQSASFQPGLMLNKRTHSNLNKPTSCALAAWQARVRMIAEQRRLSVDYQSLFHSDFRCLAGMTKHERGPLDAVEFLESKGIQIVVLPHLEHTLLDGSSVLLDNGRPVIALTLRHDRLDNFWYILFHEIGHVIRHWNSGLANGFIDDEGVTVADQFEREADEFSRNALISDEIWNSSFVRYANSRAQLEDFADSAGVGVSVVAGRLRREKGDYKLWSNLVGYGKVRKIFSAAGRLES